MRSVLLDTGPLVALFATDDKHHARFDALVLALAPKGLHLVTTWPCVVEAAYLLPPPQRFEMLQWIGIGGAAVYPFDSRHLGDMVKWMQRYYGCWEPAQSGLPGRGRQDHGRQKPSLSTIRCYF